MHNLGIAVHNFHDVHGYLPLGAGPQAQGAFSYVLPFAEDLGRNPEIPRSAGWNALASTMAAEHVVAQQPEPWWSNTGVWQEASVRRPYLVCPTADVEFPKVHEAQRIVVAITYKRGPADAAQLVLTTLDSTLPAVSTYAGVAGVSGNLGVEHFGKDDSFGDWREGIFAPRQRSLTFSDIADGTSNTLAVGEYLGEYDKSVEAWTYRGSWLGSLNLWSAKGPAAETLDAQRDRFSSPHPGEMIMFCVGDASTRPVRSKVDRDVFRAICGIRDGEAVDIRSY